MKAARGVRLAGRGRAWLGSWAVRGSGVGCSGSLPAATSEPGSRQAVAVYTRASLPAHPIMSKATTEGFATRQAGRQRRQRLSSISYRSPFSACCTCAASLASRPTARCSQQPTTPTRHCAFSQCTGTRRTRRRIGPSCAMARTFCGQSIPAPCILAARDGAIPGKAPPRGLGGLARGGGSLDSCPSRIRVSYDHRPSWPVDAQTTGSGPKKTWRIDRTRSGDAIQSIGWRPLWTNLPRRIGDGCFA